MQKSQPGRFAHISHTRIWPLSAPRRIFMARVFMVMALMLLPLVATTATAAVDRPMAAQFIERLGQDAITTLQGADLTQSQREERFAGLLHRAFELDMIARFALGRHWRAATPEQRADYLDVYRHYVIKTYARRLGDFRMQGFSVTGTTSIGAQGDVLVLTRIERSGGEPIEAGWRVREIDGTPKIIDVMVEGVSMTIMQRQEFASVTRRGSIDELVRTLRLQTARLSASAR